MALHFTTSYIEDSLALFRQYRMLADRAMEQVTDEQLFAAIDPEANSIAIIAKHLSGNMRSRWTDFLTTDGEKPDRDRDSEFVDPPATRQAVLDAWEDGWARLFQALAPLSDADLRTHGDHPRRSALRHAGDQPPGGALWASRGADRAAG